MSIIDIVTELRDLYIRENPGIEPKVIVVGIAFWGELMREVRDSYPVTSGEINAGTLMGMKVEMDGTRYYSIAIGRECRTEITEVR